MSCYKNENLIEEAIHVLAMEGVLPLYNVENIA